MSQINYSQEDLPVYLDQARYVHDHKIKKEAKYIGIKKHLGKNHNKKELRVLVDGVYKSIPL